VGKVRAIVQGWRPRHRHESILFAFAGGMEGYEVMPCLSGQAGDIYLTARAASTSSPHCVTINIAQLGASDMA